MQQYIQSDTSNNEHAVDDYLAGLPDAERAAVQHVYDMAKQLAPQAKQAVYYGMPCLKYKDKGLVSVVMTKKFLSLYPFSNWQNVLDEGQLEGFETTKGSIHFSADRPLPDAVLRAIITERKQRIDEA